MPLTRSNTGRSSSRSPLPPTQYSPRPFLPPSHYAAAAGITYYGKSPAIDQHEAAALSGSAQSRGKVDHYASAFMPVAYPSDIDSASESSTDSKANSPPEEKHPTSTKPIQRGRRQSLINDLPQLEANLLPSLRDTIDRMTRAPSQADPPMTATSTSRLDVPKPSGSIRSSRSLSPAYTTSTEAYSVESYVSNPATPMPRHQSPSQDQSYFVNAHAGLPDSLRTPVNNSTDKSTRKTSLRRPSTTDRHDVVNSSASSKPTRSALKKSSTYHPTTSSKSEGVSTFKAAMNKSPNSTLQTGRSRSRTISDFTSGSSPSYHQSGSGPVRLADSKQKKSAQPQPSSIPHHHFSPRSGLPQSKILTSTDESDSDRRYEPISERQKSIAANAGVFPSSSESEVERGAKIPIRGRCGEGESNGARRGTIRAGTQGVGLGIDIESNMKRTSSTTSREGADASSRIRRPKIHGSAPRHSDKQLVVEAKSHRDPTNRNAPEVPEEHKQRRAALLGVISRLKSEKQVPNIEHEYEEEHQFAQVGVAISGSQESLERGVENVEFPREHVYGNEFGDGIENFETPISGFHYHDAHAPARSNRTPQPTSTPSLSTNKDTAKSRFLGFPQMPLSNQRDKPRERVSSTSSRSPIIPQTDTTASNIPAALRRHLVYHPHSSKTPSGLSSKPVAHEVTADKRMSGNGRMPLASNSTAVSRTSREPSQERRDRDRDVKGNDRMQCMDRPSDGAVETREDHHLPPRQILTHADSASDLSSVGSVYWDDESESELSPAAETMFRRIGRSQKEGGDRKNHQSASERNSFRRASGSGVSGPPYTAQNHHHTQESTRSLRNEERRPRSPSFLTQSASAESEANGPETDDAHNRRHELIEEIYQIQDAFVKRLQVFINLFILPLRAQNSKEWIAGIPSEVARLFDWLEDIVVLHKQILVSLKAACDAQRPAVECVAESIRVFVPRLEVYQPYLCKMAVVIDLIDRYMQDQQDDFGEFLRLQETEPECEGWTVQHFIVEPLNILAKFPEYFSKLLELTPKDHRDYLPTFSLAHSTNMFIRVMSEVKAREDEYTLIQRISLRIKGLPPSARLATRDRRLLYHGALLLLEGDHHETSTASGLLSSGTQAAHKASKTATNDAVNQRDPLTRVRSGSSSSSSTIGGSLNSVKAPVLVSPSVLDSSPLFALFRIPSRHERLTQQELTSTLKMPVSPSPVTRSDTYAHSYDACILVQAFVFTDLVILATSKYANIPDDWTLLEHIGTVKVIGVKPGSQDSDVISVEVVTLDVCKLNQPIDVEECSTLPLRFIVPRDDGNENQSNRSSRPTEEAVLAYEERKSSWISAFQRCQKVTLCSLSVLSRNHDPKLDVEYDKQQTVFSLLASGLPIPKSPSSSMHIQMTDGDATGASDISTATTVQEREERGWWCLRFQQVFREMQRREAMLASWIHENR